MVADYYDVAQICLNGHVINSSARGFPQHNQKFCDKCGAATIMECPSCKASIQGYYHMDNVVALGGEPAAPAYCHNCGKPYPWTDTRIKAARELAQEFDISSEDKEILTESIVDIISDSPRTTLGATRFKKIMVKVGKEGTAALKNVLVDIVSEAVKKTIWPG